MDPGKTAAEAGALPSAPSLLPSTCPLLLALPPGRNRLAHARGPFPRLGWLLKVAESALPACEPVRDLQGRFGRRDEEVAASIACSAVKGLEPYAAAACAITAAAVAPEPAPATAADDDAADGTATAKGGTDPAACCTSRARTLPLSMRGSHAPPGLPGPLVPR
jgi:hypothetical protein